MRFLSVAERELRCAARQKSTYRTRWLTALLFFGLLLWLLWAMNGFTNRQAGPKVFKVFSLLTFLYCLFQATARTADCISAERREGTLGLMFLTNLNSAEIVAGKLCSSALASVYGLLAILPMLALPVLMGGIPFETVVRTALAVLNGIFFALAAGVLSSVLCKRQFTAIALAMGLSLGLGGGLFLGAQIASGFARTRLLAPWLGALSPFYSLLAADGMRFFGMTHYWRSSAAVAALSLSWLGLTTWLLARSWRDRPKRLGSWLAWGGWGREAGKAAPSAQRIALRRRLLAINPLFWLAGRQPVSAPVFMGLAVLLTMCTVYGAAPFFGRMMRVGAAAPVLGHLFAWLWSGLAIHVMVLYYAAMSASQQLAEDKQTGALELILSTPATERLIGRGLWLAYGRKMLFPGLLAVLVHLYFIWLCMVMATLESPGQIPLGFTPSQMFWSALLNQPLNGRLLDWQFGFMLRIGLLVLPLLMVVWLTLGWVGRWLGLRLKHAGFAPMAALALVFIPPILLFSLACYLADKFNLDRMPERHFLPLMMWVAVAIGLAHCLMLSVWAAMSLRTRLRSVALSRYQPPPTWRSRLPSRRALGWSALAVGALAVLGTGLVLGYFGFQNWRSQRAWRSFQASLKQSGQSLALASLLPDPAPQQLNFARSPVFVGLLSRTNRPTAELLERLNAFALSVNGPRGRPLLMDWSHQTNSELQPFLKAIRPKFKESSQSQLKSDAAGLLESLQNQSGLLAAVAAAAQRCSAFQTSSNYDSAAVLQPGQPSLLLLERLHLLFELRACASLELAQSSQAAQDVLAGLRLAQLARHSPDGASAVRVQLLLARSLQPLWEGLSQQAWKEPELAALQRELASFNLLADYTNAVGRVVLANIELWRAIPQSTNSKPAAAVARSSRSEPGVRFQPRVWWYDNCIQLHNAGQHIREQVDVSAGRIRQSNTYSELNGLPLDSVGWELLQQSLWCQPNPTCIAFAQTVLNQGLVACALERFYLARGLYPQSLEQLVPDFLARIPSDAVSGRPLPYQPGGPGRFILRGVGQNGTDDRAKQASDDWLWSYATDKPSTKPTAKKQ